MTVNIQNILVDFAIVEVTFKRGWKYLFSV